MAVIEWIRFLAGAALLLAGLAIFAIEMFGVFRFKYVMNRMHAAAMGDTLGIGFSLAGLILMSGFTFTSLKLFFVIVFLWFSSPASSHLIARLEVTTDEEKEKHYRIVSLKALEEELAGKSEKSEEPGKAGQPENPGEREKTGRPEKTEEPERAEKPENPGEPEKAEKLEKTEEPERAEKPGKSVEPKKAEKPEKTGEPETAGRPHDGKEAN